MNSWAVASAGRCIDIGSLCVCSIDVNDYIELGIVTQGLDVDDVTAVLSALYMHDADSAAFIVVEVNLAETIGRDRFGDLCPGGDPGSGLATIAGVIRS
ncbi:hypothetical protein [Arthrobacter rhizosphaerae]|uniref:hypothetical protein n=1 Tax=Arthrobacter rhizosphaerae TaxID=2855490 RepID=UPI001FF47299|nr:hypothetical protein [Arthrobacter rhizosphaerae]